MVVVGRKKLGQWEASFKYQKLVQDRLVRLLKVADLQAAYAGAELVAEEDEEDSSQTAGSKVEAVGAKGAGEGEEAKRVVGPSGISSYVWHSLARKMMMDVKLRFKNEVVK